MDFHSLTRRDLQSLCKRNKIPANKTNLAMADALNALEIVEGLDEYLNQSNSNVLQSPTSVAKLPPNTATRKTRRKTAVKAESQPSSSLLVNRSCRVTSNKSLDGEMDQENVAQEPKNNNVKFEANVAKTPAAQSTRKALGAGSCSSKVQESKKGELVQSAYSTRRSTRLLEKCMADLSLKTKETLDKPEKIEETEQEVSTEKKNPAGPEERSEEAIPGRDLSASMEKEWDVLKNVSDQVTGGLEISADFGDIAVSEANTETNKEKENEVLSDEKETENSVVQVDHQVTEEAIQENVSEPEKANTFDEEIMVDQTDGDSEAEPEEYNSGVDSDGTISEADSNQADHQEIEPATQDNDSETEKIKTLDEDTMDDQTDDDSEADPEEDNSGVDSDGTINEADSNQADHQEVEQATQENDYETEKINTFDEDAIVDQTDGDSETEPEGEDSTVDTDGTISEADSSYQAIQGTDIADGKVILPESEGSVTAPTPTLVLEEALVETTPLSPFVAQSVSAQFPRPNKSASKNSAMKLVNVENMTKENNMELMMTNVNGESKGEAAKKNKKVEFDEENLKDASMRQLVKMVKELSIKSSNNRTALKILPGNNQIAE